MQESLSKNLCECILKQGLILKQSNEKRDRFQLMVQDLIGCFPAYKKTDKYTVTNLKKKIGKMLSIRSRILKIAEQELKNIKILVFQIINKKINIRQMQKIHKRKLVIGKNREIYSSSDQSQTVKQHYISHTQKKQQQQQSQQFQQVIKQDQYQQKLQQQQYQQQQTCSIVNITPKKKKIIKRKYNCYDHDFKQEVCQYAAEKGIEATNKKYQLSIRKITSWFQAYKLNILGKGRKALDPAMEFNMSIWILKKIWNKIPLTQKTIRQKAATMKTIANAFNGSKGWLEKFFLRHVQIKSCFDFRNKIQTQEQCARYHRSAYYRMLQDYQTLKKLQCHSPIVQEDFQQIIYGNKTDPLLKTHEDGHLQKLKIGIQSLYDYEKVLNMSSVPFSGCKKIKIQQNYEQDEDDIQKQNQQSQEEYQNQSDEDNDNMSEKYVKYEESDQQSQKAVSIFEEDSDMEKDQQVKAQELLV